VPLISTANIAGQRAEDPAFQAELAARCMQEGLEVFRTRGYTTHAIARAVTMIAKAIAHNRRETMPVSILSDGYAGIDGVCLSLPCVIGAGGVHRILHPRLSETERAMLRQSAESIQHTLAMCRG
jgi:L-lactate dehydrogenase